MDDPTVLIPHFVPPETSADLAEALEADVPVVTTTTPEETRDAVNDAEILLSARVSEELIEAGSLRWIQSLSAGVDHFPFETLERHDVALTTASGVHAEPIAEQVFGYLLTFERRLHESRRNQTRGVWQRVEGGELRDKTLGIVGVGAIGSRVAELGQAFGMDVIGTKRDTDADVPVDELLPAEEYRDVCKRADYLVLACPLTDETEGLVGTAELVAMPSDAVLVNVARGEVVVEDDLVRALQYRRIAGAALDVFDEEPLDSDSPLWDLENVLVTPHMAGSTPKKTERWRELFLENYERFVAGEDLQNRVA